MKKRWTSKLTVAAWFYATACFGAEIRVPSDHSTIQKAISMAVAGDTVIVSSGTYNESISISKNIALISESGALATIIDPLGTNVVVKISGSTTRAALLRGFTIRNGKGGIDISGGAPTIADNIIVSNAVCSGAGINVYFSSPLITNNVIANNSVAGCSGGGVYLGGAAAAEIVRNVITNNTTTGLGGGIACSAAGTPVIRENLIAWNSASDGGGISMVNHSDAAITNNVIVGNQASSKGGGIYVLVPSGRLGPSVINNTIANNTNSTASGVFSDGYDKGSIYENNIIVAPGSQTSFYVGNFNDPNQPIIRYNDLYSASGSPFGGLGSSPVGINGNTSVNPQFLDPSFGDYRLRTGSPVIDTGSSTSVPLRDFGGVQRPFDGNGDGLSVVDRGAYEWIPQPPAPPVVLAGLSVGPQTFLTWRASPEATSYQIKRSTESGGVPIVLQTLTGTNFTDSNITSNRIYFYVVSASNSRGEGLDSKETPVQAGNVPPVAVTDTGTTPEDTAIELRVMANDTDPNGDSLTVISTLVVTNGFTSLSNNAVQYFPGINFNGTSWFKYVVSDGRGAFATGQVSVLVTPVNDRPSASTGSLDVPGNSRGVAVTLSGFDVDGDPLTFQVLTLPTKGLLDTNALVYRPAHGFSGNDSFTFQAHDGQTNSAARTFTLRVQSLVDTNADLIPDVWATLYGIVDADGDEDRDGLSNREEYLANTHPRDSSSVLQIGTPTTDNAGRPVIIWPSVGGTRYRILTARENVSGSAVDLTEVVRSADIEIDPSPYGTPSMMSFTDTDGSPAVDTRIYRVKVVRQ